MKLKSSTDKLLDFRVDDCGMSHEIVPRETGSIMPLPPRFPSETSYKRHGLCERQKRYHLGCPHTMARVHFKHIAEDLIKTGAADNKLIQDYLRELNKIEMNIIEIDTLRGETEVEHARASEALFHVHATDVEQQKILEKKIEVIDKKIEHCINDHKRCNSELRALQKNLVENLK